MIGYDPKFIGDGINIPLPTFGRSLTHNVLRLPNRLREGIYSDYPHYTLVMNKDTDQLVYSALNIDQNLIWSKQYGKGKRKITVNGSKGWTFDKTIGKENQIGNDYYKDRKNSDGEEILNPYDRGHMAMRANTLWGRTKKIAEDAGKATYIYANASLQHENLNQDEWKELELDIVGGLQQDANGKIAVFTGPIFGRLDRAVHLSYRDSARVPGGYFKVICYRTKHSEPSKRLGVLVFAIFQDAKILRDDKGPTIKTDMTYQVTIKQLQKLTDINFGQQLFDRNPLYYYDGSVVDAKIKISRTPEVIPIQRRQNLITDHSDNRCDITELASRSIVINSAMINPIGNERKNEWISLFNRSSRRINLKNWKIVDGFGRKTEINIGINSGEAVRIRGKKMGKIRLGNNGGSLMLSDDHGCFMDRVTWGQSDAKRVVEGLAYQFETGQ